MIGKEKLISLADDAFDQMEEEAPDVATLGAVVLICEVRMRDPDQTAIYEFSTDSRTWVQKAILREALESIGLGVQEVD